MDLVLSLETRNPTPLQHFGVVQGSGVVQLEWCKGVEWCNWSGAREWSFVRNYNNGKINIFLLIAKKGDNNQKKK